MAITALDDSTSNPAHASRGSSASAFTWNKVDLFFGLMQGICLLCVACQVIIDAGPDNLNSVVLVALSSSLVFQYLWRSGAPRDYPVSSLAILGICVTTEFAALVAQTLSWTAFTSSLRWPLTTFAVLATVQLLVVCSHWVYRHLALTNAATKFIADKLLSPIGALSVPPVTTIWVMAAIGLVATASAGGVAMGDVGGKAFQAFDFMAYMPFLILIYHRRHGQAYCDMKKQGPLILAYLALQILVAILRNSRQLMAIGPVQGCLVFLVYFLQDPTPITRRTITRLAAGTAAVAIAIVLFSDLAIAMVITREKIKELKPQEMVEETLRTLADRPRLEQYRQTERNVAEFKRYEENYLSSPVIARFSETKFHDNNIFFATNTTDDERREVWQLTTDKVLAILPQPLLDALDIKLDKNSVMFTFGDFNRYLNEGPDGSLGGFATGSIWAHVIILFGLGWAPVVVVVTFLLTFIMLDGLSRRGDGFDVAPMAMCSIWQIFIYGLGGESLVYNFGLYTRDLPQRLMLYLVVFGGVKLAASLYKGRPS